MGTPWMDPRSLGAILFLMMMIALANAAPVEDSWDKALDYPEDGCYYQYQHYEEGEQIRTSEPCLNCTCHNQMLMCYLRVCPFIKPVGKNCIVEKREDQCCPTIMCPEVPVTLWTSTTTTLAPMIEADPQTGETLTESTSIQLPSGGSQGCIIGDNIYQDGMQVPREPERPCELCYCIRNTTACVMQECTLKVPGCEPIFQEGVCCPVSYMCADGITLPGLLGFNRASTESPSTTTKPQGGCMQNGLFYADGASIDSVDPCEHCYCMKGDIVCAVEPCLGAMDGESDSCVALPPPEGSCCPTEYKCEPTKMPIAQAHSQVKPEIMEIQQNHDNTHLHDQTNVPAAQPDIVAKFGVPADDEEILDDDTDYEAPQETLLVPEENRTEQTGLLEAANEENSQAETTLAPQTEEESEVTSAPESSSESSSEGAEESEEQKPDETDDQSDEESVSTTLAPQSEVASEEADVEKPEEEKVEPNEEVEIQEVTTQAPESEDPAEVEEASATEAGTDHAEVEEVPEATKQEEVNETADSGEATEATGNEEVAEGTEANEAAEVETEAPEAVEIPEVESVPATTEAPEIEQVLPVTDAPEVEDISEIELVPATTEAFEIEEVPAVTDAPDVEEAPSATDTTLAEEEAPVATEAQEAEENQVTTEATEVEQVPTETAIDPEEVSEVTVVGEATGEDIEEVEALETAMTTTEEPDSIEGSSESVTESENTVDPDATETEETATELPKSCSKDGNEYNHLSDVPDADPCQLCQCDNGNVICATEVCPDQPKNYKNCKPIPQDGECCPKYECDDETTARAEALKPSGEEVFTKSGANEKDQTIEIPNIDENEIFDDDTDDEYVIEDLCVENGVTYRDQEDVPHHNPCKLCFCQVGTVICADRECLTPKGYEDCTPLPTPQGQCCPDQFECKKEEAASVMVTIAPTEEEMTTLSLDEGSCMVENIAYLNGSSIPVQDKCDDSCFCDNGKVQCEKKPCPENHIEPGMVCKEFYMEGECCPSHDCVLEEGSELESESHTITTDAPIEEEEPSMTTMSSVEEEMSEESESTDSTMGPDGIDQVDSGSEAPQEEVTTTVSLTGSENEENETTEEEQKTEMTTQQEGLSQVDASAEEETEDPSETETVTEMSEIGMEVSESTDAPSEEEVTMKAMEMEQEGSEVTTTSVEEEEITTMASMEEKAEEEMAATESPVENEDGSLEAENEATGSPIDEESEPFEITMTPEESELDSVTEESEVNQEEETMQTTMATDEETETATDKPDETLEESNEFEPQETTSSPAEEESDENDATKSPIDEEESEEATLVTLEEEESSVDTTKAPIEEESAPVETTQASMEEESGAMETTQAPLEEENIAEETTSASAEEDNSALLEEENAVAETTQTPLEEDNVAVETTISPIEEAAFEVTTLAPVEEEAPEMTTNAPDEEEVAEVATLAPVEEEVAEVATLAPVEEEVAEATTLAPVEEEAVEVTTLAPVEGEAVEVTTLAPVEGEAVEVTTLASRPDESSLVETTQAPETEEPSSNTTYCIHNGMIIQDGKDVPNGNACELCQCLFGQVICAERECPPAPAGCAVLPLKEGNCCPEYKCPVAEDDEILDDDTDDVASEVNANDILKKGSLPEDPIDELGEDKISTVEEKPAALPSVSGAPTYAPEFLEDEESKSTSEASVVGTASSDVLENLGDNFSTSPAPIDEYEYEDELTLDSIGPGACLFEGKVYVSAQQIPRTNPCDFCFCFRGDIICLQQSCPPPIPGCQEEAISGFCCPRYECPVKGGTQNITIPAPPREPSIASWLFGGDQDQDQPSEITQQISGCEVQGRFYEVGAIVESSSGPCLQCRCGFDEKLECEPLACEPQPMMQKMLAIRR